jgi:hypothetical protein
MNKNLLFVLLLIACSSQEERILKRQREINKESIRLMVDYNKKHPKIDSFGVKPINADEQLSYANKISSLKKERDSLQQVLDSLRSKK